MSITGRFLTSITLVWLLFSAFGVDARINSQNFTFCDDTSSLLKVYSAERYYDPDTSNYNFTINGSPEVTLTNVTNSTNTLSTIFTKTYIFLWQVYYQRESVYSSLQGPGVVEGATQEVAGGQNLTLLKSFFLPSTAMPLGDISTTIYISTGIEQFTCINLEPTGYQNPIWKQIFIYVPVIIAVFSALVSFVSTFIASGPSVSVDTQADFFVLASNYAMDRRLLRLKTPGFFDVIFYTQFIVLSAQLSLAYPPFYQLFAADFAWGNLLFPTDYINQKLTNAMSVMTNDPNAALFKRQLANDAQSTFASNSSASYFSAATDETGLGNFGDALGISAQNLFLTCLLWFTIVFAAVNLIILFSWMVVEYLGWWYPVRFGGKGERIWNFSMGTLLRVLLLFYLPLTTYAFYQLMLPAPWWVMFLAAVMLVGPLLGLFFYIGYNLLKLRPPSILFDDIQMLLKYGSLYNTFTDETFPFFIVILTHKMIQGLMIGLFQSNGLAQAIVIMLTELVFFAVMLYKRPYVDSAINTLYLCLTIIRFITSAFNLVYIDSFDVPSDTKQWVAYAQIFLHLVVLIFFFALPAKNLIVMCKGIDKSITASNSGLDWVGRRRRNRDSRVLETSEVDADNSFGFPLRAASRFRSVSTQGANDGLPGAHRRQNSVIGGRPSRDDFRNAGGTDLGTVTENRRSWSAEERFAAGGGVYGGYNNNGHRNMQNIELQQFDNYYDNSVTVPPNVALPVLPTEPHRRKLSLNLDALQQQSQQQKSGKTFYRHSRKSIKRMSRNLEDALSANGMLSGDNSSVGGGSSGGGWESHHSANDNGSTGERYSPRSSLGEMDLMALAPNVNSPQTPCHYCGSLNYCMCTGPLAHSRQPSPPPWTTHPSSRAISSRPRVESDASSSGASEDYARSERQTRGYGLNEEGYFPNEDTSHLYSAEVNVEDGIEGNGTWEAE